MGWVPPPGPAIATFLHRCDHFTLLPPLYIRDSLPLPSPTRSLSFPHLLAYSPSILRRRVCVQSNNMAKGGKLTKLKSVLKKWNSFGNGNGSGKRNSISAVADEESSSPSSSSSRSDLHNVYVGKSRRLYRVSSDVVDHPVFRELVERSRESQEQNDTVNVACEVVLFEHLLWMLENADPQPESLDELVDFYAC